MFNKIIDYKNSVQNEWDEFDEFDLALGLYHWLQHNWIGSADPLYAAFCVLTEPGMFNPGMSQEFNNLGHEAKTVYEMLTLDNYESALNRVLNYEPQG